MASLQDSVEFLSGVGKKRRQDLATLGIFTIEDLLTYYPRRYDDLSVKDIFTIADQAKTTLKGTVTSAPIIVRFGQRKNRLNFKLLVNQEVINVTFFNQPYLKSKVDIGKELAIYGRWDAGRKQLNGLKIIADINNHDTPGLGAIYPVNQHIHQATLRKLIKQAFENYRNVIVNILPPVIMQRRQMLPRFQMIQQMHFPKTSAESTEATKSAEYEEFFLFQLQIQQLKRVDSTEHGLTIDYDNPELKAFIQTLPFELTADQKKVVNEICRDLKRPIHMNRLLQGDVGSGKTVVAAIAMYAAITAGFQAAIMVPTEILAEQHANNFAELFANFHANVGLLTGSMTPKQHRALLGQIKNGQINLIVGTHALIQEDVNYANLGLIVTDEQHRFGVDQRKQFRTKGAKPDVLAMTATPIPRTLAITAYGEMDVSIISQLPAGRKKIITKWIRSNQFATALDFAKRELAVGRQMYVVTPLISESEALDVQNAEALAENLTTFFGKQVIVGLLHGRMPSQEKDQVMQSFQKNQIQVLVSTTVIEVGVDVTNATIMLIYDADRFGLAQLHQLRGRVGRGKNQAYCILVADPKNQTATKRLETMVKVDNGFVLAQKDLELRGSGDVLGTKQSGMPRFKVGDPVADLSVMEDAQNAAVAVLDNPLWYTQPDNQELVKFLKIRKIKTKFD